MAQLLASIIEPIEKHTPRLIIGKNLHAYAMVFSGEYAGDADRYIITCGMAFNDAKSKEEFIKTMHINADHLQPQGHVFHKEYDIYAPDVFEDMSPCDIARRFYESWHKELIDFTQHPDYAKLIEVIPNSN